MRAVILEDDDSLRLLVRVMLELDCHATVVGEAANTVDGLALIRASRPDVAVLDLRPPVNGLDVIRAIRSERLPVVLIAYSGDEEMRTEAITAGADAAICKSTDTVELCQAVSDLLVMT